MPNRIEVGSRSVCSATDPVTKSIFPSYQTQTPFCRPVTPSEITDLVSVAPLS